MAASDEWEIFYLTDTGWVLGGYRLDCGDKQEDTKPQGAVMWARRHVTVGKLGAPSSVKAIESEGHLIQDKQKVELLLKKYGKPQFGV